MESNGLSLYNDYDRFYKIAESIYKSRCASKPWITSVESVMYIMQRGANIGIDPLTALEELTKVRDSWMLSIKLARGMAAEKGITWTIKDTKDSCTINMKREGWDDHTETVTVEDLQRSGKANQKDQAFMRFPTQVLRAAAFRRCINVVGPDVLMGLVAMDRDHEKPEDFQGFDAEEVTETDVKPKKTRQTKKSKEVKPEDKVAVALEEEPPLPDEPDSAPVGRRWDDNRKIWVRNSDDKEVNEAGEQVFLYKKGWRTSEELDALKKKAAPKPVADKPKLAAVPDDFDLAPAKVADTMAMFDPKKNDHMQLLFSAIKKMVSLVGGQKTPLTPDDQAYIRDNFMTFLSENPLPATEEGLVRGMQACLKQRT